MKRLSPHPNITSELCPPYISLFDAFVYAFLPQIPNPFAILSPDLRTIHTQS